jgi:hypothetical protein
MIKFDGSGTRSSISIVDVLYVGGDAWGNLIVLVISQH